MCNTADDEVRTGEDYFTEFLDENQYLLYQFEGISLDRLCGILSALEAGGGTDLLQQTSIDLFNAFVSTCLSDEFDVIDCANEVIKDVFIQPQEK